MDHIVIRDSTGWDGRYEFDLTESINSFSVREWGWIKRLSGYLPMSIDEGLLGADPELIATFAVLALRRAGKVRNHEVTEVFERLADAPYTAITVEFGKDEQEQEDESNPPPTRSDASASISGTNGRASSENSGAIHSPTGTLVSATSESDRPRSGS